MMMDGGREICAWKFKIEDETRKPLLRDGCKRPSFSIFIKKNLFKEKKVKSCTEESRIFKWI